jgi:TM2 domain-containing membrane protein YozV
MTPIIAAILGACCITGISQMLMGQPGKGVVILLSAIALAIATGGLALVAIHIAVAIDAYMVADTLRHGREVGPWEFFPT